MRGTAFLLRRRRQLRSEPLNSLTVSSLCSRGRSSSTDSVSSYSAEAAANIEPAFSPETTYANYERICRNYDDLRQVIGCKVIRQKLKQMIADKCIHTKTKSTNTADAAVVNPVLKILDAGCGTANYVQSVNEFLLNQQMIEFMYGASEPLRNCVLSFDFEIHALDANKHMLDVGRSKCKQYNNYSQLHFHHESLLKMDAIATFDSDSAAALNYFDCILINQVLHHLDTNETRIRDFANIRRALRLCYERLAIGGSLIINHSLPHQLHPGIWFYELVPKASAIMQQKYPDSDWIRNYFAHLSEHTAEVQDIIIHEPFINSDAYFDLCGPFSEKWRACDSIWQLVDDEELFHCQSQLKQIIDAGMAFETSFKSKAIQNLMTFGHSTTYIITKTA